MNQTITASRLNSLVSCPRKHFWQYEIGLKKDAPALALRFGSAWARGMESYWRGDLYEAALAHAIPEGVDLDELNCSIIASLLAAYFDYYGPASQYGRMKPEVEFGPHEIEGTDFTAQGKLDALGILTDGRGAIIEAKTTSDSIGDDSDYWLRLRFNQQILHYVLEERSLGASIQTVLYDVTRKPAIAPKMIDDRDEHGLKIVTDAQGGRQFKPGKTRTIKEKREVVVKKAKGKTKAVKKFETVTRQVTEPGEPYQSASVEKGWTVKQHLETPDEFGQRLYDDVMERPKFYFTRREVPVSEDDLEQFQRQRLALCYLIDHFRYKEAGGSFPQPVRDPDQWPRNVGENTCNFCQYKSFCLQNLSVNLNQPPNGFSIQPFNPELENK